MDNSKENRAHRISNPMRKRLFTIKEAAVYLGRPVWGVRTLIWNGRIPVIQDGRKYFIDINDLDDYIERQKFRVL
ncbi:MAG TPA: helix-turn-helix domain-containing protein [Deltaproteobacteria bacterium]|nr:helix-turn-helix domain-containing protein [Deltaproteobacteria bacterium]